MKLIKKYDYVEEAELLARELEMRGIVTHISSRESQKLSRILTGAFTVGLWAVLPDQHADAEKFVADQSHLITSGLSPEQIAELKKQVEHTTFKSLNYAILCGVMLIFIIISILLAIEKIA